MRPEDSKEVCKGVIHYDYLFWKLLALRGLEVGVLSRYVAAFLFAH